MKAKKKSLKAVGRYRKGPIAWLPIDSRLFLPFFKLERVSGMSRFFLEFEITLCVVIVIGTLLVAAIKISQYFL